MKNLPDWFFDKTDWQEKIFENEFVFIPTNNLTRSNLNYLGGEIKNIHYGDILTKFNNVLDASSNEIPFVNLDVDLKNKIYLQDGDIIFADTAEDYTAGKVIEIQNVNENLLVSGLHTIACRPRKTFANSFLGYYLNSNQFRSQILPLIVGIKVMSISKSILQKTILKIPPLETQKQIADYFTHLDNAINAQELKLKSWHDAKKAMLQKIFSQEFYFTADNGEKYPAWQEKFVGDVCKIQTGTGNKQDKVDNGIYNFYVRSQTVEHSDKYIFDGEAVLTAGDGVGVGKIFHYINGKFNFHQRVYAMTNFQNVIGKYFYYYFSQHFYKRVKKISAKNSVDSVRMDMIAEMKIKIPRIEEQKKIADYFSSLDKIIDAENKILESLRLVKRGLLQKLFV